MVQTGKESDKQTKILKEKESDIQTQIDIQRQTHADKVRVILTDRERVR